MLVKYTIEGADHVADLDSLIDDNGHDEEFLDSLPSMIDCLNRGKEWHIFGGAGPTIIIHAVSA